MNPHRKNVQAFGRACGLGLLWLICVGCDFFGSGPLHAGHADAPSVPGALQTLRTVEAGGASPPTVILISLDGTRPADLAAGLLPAITRLAEEGASAEGLQPVDPSNTFPSHVSMATGVLPEKHRLVNNAFIDPDRGRFERKDAHLWIEAEPIWSIAERAGIPTASFHWVGSEGPTRGGLAPRSFEVFSSKTGERKKVDQILAWLDLEDPAERPRLITSWFHGADHAAHIGGPGAPGVAQSLEPQNRAIERLIDGVARRGLWSSTTLLFVADHGMAEASERINLAWKIGRARLGVSVIGTGGFAMIVFKPGRKTPERVARAVSIAREAGLEAWPRESAPDDWRVGDVRFGDIVVRAPLGKAIVTPFTRIDGFHGYDGRLPEMAGLFVAYGRGVAPGVRLSPVSGLSVAPTVLRLLGLEIPDAMEAAPLDALLAGRALRAGDVVVLSRD